MTRTEKENSRLVEFEGNLRACYVTSNPAALARLKGKTHLLNEIHEDAKDLSRNLGKRIKGLWTNTFKRFPNWKRKLPTTVSGRKRIRDRSPEIQLDIEFTGVENYIRTMYDLMYIAFKSDISRVRLIKLRPRGGRLR